MTMKVTLSGPILVNAIKNMLKAVEKGLMEIGKIGRLQVQQGTPVATGFLRGSIRETKPTVSRAKASIIISAGWTNRGGTDVVYAHFIETGKRYPSGKQTAYKGAGMFKKGQSFLQQRTSQNKFQKIIVQDLGGR